METLLYGTIYLYGIFVGFILGLFVGLSND